MFSLTVVLALVARLVPLAARLVQQQVALPKLPRPVPLPGGAVGLKSGGSMAVCMVVALVGAFILL